MINKVFKFDQIMTTAPAENRNKKYQYLTA